ncbi:MAG: hypothetical protein EOO57_24750, partial [Hymenobacter sp.]
MQVLDLPPFDHKIRQNSANIPEIWDELRRKYVVLTPEEWVRQHMVQYLLRHLGYPRGLLSLERGHRYNQRQKRTDLVALGPDGRRDGHRGALALYQQQRVAVGAEGHEVGTLLA